jgi:hypothetical protein
VCARIRHPDDQDGSRLFRKIEQFGRRDLHPESQLVRSDARGDLRVACLQLSPFIQQSHGVQRALCSLRLIPAGLDGYEIRSPVFASRVP